MVKIHLPENVFEAGLKRIRYLFDEFPNVVVGYSGGKDSTIILNLALIVAEEKGRLPLPVMFLDQEGEWQMTIDIVKKVMYDTRVKPMWFQVPMVMTNNASTTERFTKIWDKEQKDKWIHPQDPISIKENIYGTNRFHDMFGAIFKHEFKGQKACYLSGVRTEESPARAVALTYDVTYKGLTYGKVLDKEQEHYTFYPIYDWLLTDVWKAIHENKWEYNKLYDAMYSHGIPVYDMRVSNVHHETSVNNLTFLQDIEPATWVKLTNKIQGANTIKHMKTDAYKCPKEFPPMFDSWKDYAMHLTKHLVPDEKNKKKLIKIISEWEPMYGNTPIAYKFWKTIIDTILLSDWDFTKLANFNVYKEAMNFRRFYKGIYRKEMLQSDKLSEEQKMVIKEYLTKQLNEKA